MTDGQIALVTLLAFTFYECTRWLPARAWLFQAISADHWKRSTTWDTARARGGGPALINPLPPIRVHLPSAAWPCTPHEKTLAVWNDEKGALFHVPWDEVKPRHEGALLYINAVHQVRCINAKSAAEWTSLIKVWKQQTQQEREAGFAKKADAMLDTQALKAHVETLFDITQTLRWYGALVAICMFILLPFVYWLRGDTLPSYIILGLLFLMMIVQSIMLWRITCKHPALKKERMQHIFAAAIFPPSSMRAADWVCATLADEYHPLAAHHAWSSADDFLQQSRITWRETLWPKRNDGVAQQQPSQSPDVEALKRFFTAHHVEMETLEPQLNAQEGCTQYCPRCLTQFLPAASGCKDCSNLPLQPLVRA